MEFGPFGNRTALSRQWPDGHFPDKARLVRGGYGTEPRSWSYGTGATKRGYISDWGWGPRGGGFDAGDNYNRVGGWVDSVGSRGRVDRRCARPLWLRVLPVEVCRSAAEWLAESRCRKPASAVIAAMSLAASSACLVAAIMTAAACREKP